MVDAKAVSVPSRYWIWGLVILFFGGIMIGIDQSMVGSALPDLESTFHFSTFGGGLVEAVQSIAEGVVGFLGAGWLSDKIGSRKQVMVPSLIGFGLMSGLTGLVTGYGELLAVRLVMGAFAGGWMILMFAKGTEDPPERFRALSSGVTLASISIGLGLIAPLIGTKIIADYGWRPSFWIVGIPSIIIALVAAKVLPSGIQHNVKPLEDATHPLTLTEAFRFKNVIVSSIVSALVFGTLTLFIVFGIVFILHEHFTIVAAGAALSGWGVGGVIGSLVLPMLSNIVGRKAVGAGSLIIGAFGVYAFTIVHSGAGIFVLMFLIGFFIQGAEALYQVLIPGETVPDLVRGKAIGLVAIGTVGLGSGVFTIILGAIGQSIGLADTFRLGFAFCLIAALLTIVGIRETAPRLVARQGAQAKRQAL